MAARWLDAVRLDGSMPTDDVVSLDGWMAGSMARLDGRLDGASMAPRWRLDGASMARCPKAVTPPSVGIKPRWLDGSMARWLARWLARCGSIWANQQPTQQHCHSIYVFNYTQIGLIHGLTVYIGTKVKTCRVLVALL